MKKRKALLWLLLIPAQLLLGALFTLLGAVIDSAIFSGGGQGHGIPLCTVLFPLIAAAVTVIVIVFALVKTIRGLRLARREEDAPRDEL